LLGVHLATDGYKVVPEGAYVQSHDTRLILFPQVLNVLTAEHERYPAAAVAHKAAQVATLTQQKGG